jgi:putative PIN family toxin of toxin-antitoxin system
VKVVFDTNVLISAFIANGICTRVTIRARKRQFQLITRPFILKEVESVLAKKIQASNDEVKTALELISQTVYEIVYPAGVIIDVCRDADDNRVLECALHAKADYVVTGDMDLLELKSYKGIEIITPRDFELLFDD